jgi:ATP-binding cassette subfamily F protein uup
MAPPLLTLKDICLSFGAKELFRDLSLSIPQGEHLCLVGKNGSGKSTLLKMMAGFLEPDQGNVFTQPGVHLYYCPQEPDFSSYDTLEDYCMSGLFSHQKTETYRVDSLVTHIKLDGKKSPLTASGGEKRRAALVAAFVGDPDIILLDEPTNHLDLEGIMWLEDKLKTYTGACILISHDRRFLKNVSQATLWLDRGFVRRMNKSYDHFESWAQTVLEQEIREQKKLNKVIAQETLWSHQGITARRKRNQGRLQRLYELRARKANHIGQRGKVKLSLKEGEMPSQLVIEAKNISKSYEGRTLFKDFTTRILTGDRIGIVGPNGCGKSTLVKTLLGEIPVDSGYVRLGKNLNPLYFDQNKEDLDPQETLWSTLAIGGTDQVMVQGHLRHVVAYIKDFLFDVDQAKSPVSSLSGGEKSRLLLAKYLACPNNFLILDEPTNDLDMDTMDLLTDVLFDFQGTIIIISHDRDFLDQLVTSTFIFTEHQELFEVAGGYSDAVAYVQNHGHSPPLRKPIKVVAKPASSAPIAKAKTRLSYHEQRLLEVLPKEIETLENRLQDVNRLLEDPDLYQQDPQAFARLTEESSHLTETIEEKEFHWLSLEEKRGSLREDDRT